MENDSRDYRETLNLPQTDFPMKAGLPKREPEILANWARIGLYDKLRTQGKGREKFVLHDGPPYANGDVHIGLALNKILKDVIVRSQQMMGAGSRSAVACAPAVCPCGTCRLAWRRLGGKASLLGLSKSSMTCPTAAGSALPW